MKKFLIAILSLVLAMSTFGTVAVFAAEQTAGNWTYDDTTTAVTDTTETGATVTQNTLGTASSVTYTGALNLETGANVAFGVSAFNMSADATEMMTFTFTDDGGDGIRLVARMLYADRATMNRKIRWDIYYIHDGFDGGSYYAESVYTYRRILADDHSIDIQHMLGSYYVTVDDVTFIPKSEVNGLDLDNCTLTITANSTSGNAAVYTVTEVGTDVSDLQDGEWMDLGTSELTYNDDGTMTYTDIDEEYSQDEASEVLFLRNAVANVKGYDVTQPFEITIHYDTSATPGVWWGLGFATSPFANLTTMTFDEEGNVDDAYGSGDINKNKGIMFQTTTGLAEPYYTQDTSAQRPYADNGGGASYSGQEMLNTIRVEIGTDSTDIYWNGTILFEDYSLTQSDFDSSDGKVYPYFRFIESPSNQYKTNTLTIKGINTPTVEESATTLQRRFDETEPLVLTVDDRDNGDIVFAKSDRTAIDSSLVSYDAEANTLTIQAEAFADVTEAGTYTYLVGNDGGYQPITIVFAEEFESLQSPELSITTYTMVEGQAPEGGLTFTADLKNGEFVSLVGSGLSRSQYTMTLDEATNVATFVISQDFLNNLAIGERTLTLRTQSTDGTETEASAQLVITVTDESGNSGGGNTGDNGGDNGGEATPSGGCSSTAAGAAVGIGGVLLVAAAAVCVFKKRA